MTMHISIYPIYGLADQIDSEPFDLGRLPFKVMPDVTIEDVRACSGTTHGHGSSGR